jgi:hypothetical protein
MNTEITEIQKLANNLCGKCVCSEREKDRRDERWKLTINICNGPFHTCQLQGSWILTFVSSDDAHVTETAMCYTQTNDICVTKRNANRVTEVFRAGWHGEFKQLGRNWVWSVPKCHPRIHLDRLETVSQLVSQDSGCFSRVSNRILPNTSQTLQTSTTFVL